MDNLAWKKALILRGCPPADILFGPGDEQLRAHLDVCPACRDSLAMTSGERAEWAGLGRALAPEPPPAPSGKAPGQVWRIRPDLAGWGPKYRYCNPPLVLLLDFPENNLTQVAQIYPGDDFLTEEDVPLPGLGFAQPWNTYSLALNDLEAFQGEASGGGANVASEVLARSRDSFADLDEASPLFWFRTMELDLGAHFAGQSLTGVLEGADHDALLDAPLVPLGEMSVDALCQALERKGQTVPLHGGDPLLELARYNQEDTTWGLAASGERTQTVNYALLDDVGLEIRQTTVVFSAVVYQDGMLTLAGEVRAESARTEAIFAWWDAQGRMIWPIASDISDDGRYFNLRFTEVAEREFRIGRLVVLFSGRQ
ncbi:MAG: hypothetical protein EA399_02005 [Desulfovibrionales bacterium]|nr:MAG: hypothetical protein EA399_02005 [Desulfovibrionales bacterium]